MYDPMSIFYFIVLIASIIIHEVAHGLAAEREGDPTARVLGRITLNPLKHIDVIGSIVLPFLLIISHAGVVIGWAKPVPYNVDNLKRGKKSVAIVSMAGIIANLLIATVFGIAIRLMVSFGAPMNAFAEISSIIVLVNIVLALFNAIPLAPLDGFRFLQAVLPRRAEKTLSFIERYSLPLLIIFIFFGWRVVAPFALTLYTLLTGIAL